MVRCRPIYSRFHVVRGCVRAVPAEASATAAADVSEPEPEKRRALLPEARARAPCIRRSHPAFSHGSSPSARS
eukprot:6208509-Pleurochrysis_carterae.AAC.4